MAITDAGHSFAHFPHPIHVSGFTFARMPFHMEIACLGQTFTQQPQATQSWLFTNAFRFFLIFVSKIKPPVYVWGKSFKFVRVTYKGLSCFPEI